MSEELVVRGILVVKIGGKAAEDEKRLRELGLEIASLPAASRALLVHGGGAEVTSVSRRLGIESVFHNGVRQTSAAEMNIVDMVLGGRLNAQLVRLMRSCGLDAVGLSGSDGGMFIGRPLPDALGNGESRTGEIARIDARLLLLLLEKGFLPVVSPTSMDQGGKGLNINADSVAFGLAAGLAASSLVFLSDIPGVLRNGEPVSELGGEEARQLIATGIISGGMIPKVEASLDALSRGVGNVIIGQYEGAGSLADLLAGRRGTRIRKKGRE